MGATGSEVWCGVHCSQTVERGTRDSSPQGWVYGVSGNSAHQTGRDAHQASLLHYFYE